MISDIKHAMWAPHYPETSTTYWLYTSRNTIPTLPLTDGSINLVQSPVAPTFPRMDRGKTNDSFHSLPEASHTYTYTLTPTPTPTPLYRLLHTKTSHLSLTLSLALSRSLSLFSLSIITSTTPARTSGNDLPAGTSTTKPKPSWMSLTLHSPYRSRSWAVCEGWELKRGSKRERMRRKSLLVQIDGNIPFIGGGSSKLLLRCASLA